MVLDPIDHDLDAEAGVLCVLLLEPLEEVRHQSGGMVSSEHLMEDFNSNVFEVGFVELHPVKEEVVN